MLHQRKGARTVPPKKNLLPTFEIRFENRYVLKGELYPGLAPNTVGNFIHLANSGFYDGAVIVKAHEDSLLRIDHPTEQPPYCVDGEMLLNDCTYNTGKLSYGGLCMFHPNGFYKVRSEFMIVLSAEQRNLRLFSADYPFFGQVLEGMRFASLLSRNSWDCIKRCPIHHRIETIRVDTHGREYPFQTIPVPEGYPQST